MKFRTLLIVFCGVALVLVMIFGHSSKPAEKAAAQPPKAAVMERNLTGVHGLKAEDIARICTYVSRGNPAAFDQCSEEHKKRVGQGLSKMDVMVLNTLAREGQKKK